MSSLGYRCTHSRGLELYSLGMRAKRAEARKKDVGYGAMHDGHGAMAP